MISHFKIHLIKQEKVTTREKERAIIILEAKLISSPAEKRVLSHNFEDCLLVARTMNHELYDKSIYY